MSADFLCISLFCTPKLLLTCALEIGMEGERCTESSIHDPLLISRDTNDFTGEKRFFPRILSFMTELTSFKILSQTSVLSELS